MYELRKHSLFNNNEFLHTHADRTVLGLEKGQSAIEYLMTYGWMLLVVAVVGGAVFSVVGDQNVESVNGFTGDDVQVDDFGPNSDEGLDLVLRNSASETVEINSVNVTDGEDYTEFIGDQEIGVGSTDNIELANVSETDGSNELDVEVDYSVGGLSDLQASGSITGGLEISESGSSTGSGDGGSEDDDTETVSSPSVGGDWSRVEPASAEGGYDYFFNESSGDNEYLGDTSVEYTDDGFFVMKYKASNNGSDVPQSVSDEEGWNDISFDDSSDPGAVEACEALDSETSDYDIHLTTNREWMTTARQVAQDSSNWADGDIGSEGESGGLFQGNHDQGDDYDRAVDLDDVPESADAGGETERTHELASGDNIWDMSGDLYQWVDVEEDGSTMNDQDSSDDKIYEKNPESSEVEDGDGLGNDYGLDDGDAALRGGRWNIGDSSGVFLARSRTPDNSHASAGFRCSAVPVS